MPLVRAYLYAGLWALLILGLCGMNGNNIPQISFDFGIDKIAHFILFGSQSWLILTGIKAHTQKPLSWNQLHLAVVFSIVYGVLIEILQATIFINRTFDFADMLADAIGALLCYPLARWYFR